MTRRSFLSTAAASLAAPVERPNILILLTDQQSPEALSAAGNPWLQTPAMDSLAARGVSFSETYCTYPVCSPSRGSIFTGRMPHETGVRANNQAIHAGMATMGELFTQAGYETVYGGKWHLPRPNGDVRGFRRISSKSGKGAQMDGPLATDCAAWLRNRKEKDPFLMVASFLNPHDICDWIRAHPGAHSYPDIGKFPPAPANMAVDPLEPEFLQYHRTTGYDLMSQAVGIASQWLRDDVRHYLHGYYRFVEDVDREIGRVLQALHDTQLDRNTLVVFASDHGEGMGAHRWVQKAAFWEETAKVPLIIAGPGVDQGKVDRRSLASLADILPTLCDFASIAPPPDQRGVSLRPALTGQHLTRPFVVSELLYGGQSREGRMLRTSRYKYVRFNGGARPEQLFDLLADPGESHNMARSDAASSVLQEHRRLLKSWISATADEFHSSG